MADPNWQSGQKKKWGILVMVCILLALGGIGVAAIMEKPLGLIGAIISLVFGALAMHFGVKYQVAAKHCLPHTLPAWTEEDEKAKHGDVEPKSELLNDDMEAAGDEAYTEGNRLYFAVRTGAVLGTDRLAILKRKVKRVEGITQDEADKILALFALEDHAFAAYDLVKDKIMSREEERTKSSARKTKHLKSKKSTKADGDKSEKSDIEYKEDANDEA